MVQSIGSGLVGLHIRGVLTGNLFAIFRNFLALGRTIFPGLSNTQNVKAS